ncbi:MAG TPA: glycerophosphodiester phosphodiesterase [Acidimicrobiaceae bacterium]|nr:glycerophosphodiester phosphodiesterase [Acidimicrobiaceae bacterium]HCB37666.1 glycerophosphodiester phosphodiesterase [Acidimicrobiaceae bacterium]
MQPSHPYLALPSPVPIAHRGGDAVWPQNTMTAFAGAVGLGCQYLETDVRATADDKLVVFHDPTLDPVSDSAGAVDELTWDEVSRARVAGTEPIPLLDDVLDAWPDVRVCIDPKADSAVVPLIKALRRPGVLERVCVGSFSDERLARLDAEFGPAVCLGMGPREIVRFRLGSLLRRRPGNTPRYRANTLQIPVRQYMVPLATAGVVRYAHAHGIDVHVWTIDDPTEMSRLLDKGVDGIITAEPKVLLDVLRGRGQWPPVAG